MGKKDKDIQVRLEEVEKNINGTKFAAYELAIGKKTLGVIIEKSAKSFEIEMTDGYKAVAKTLDEAVELVIRRWNLND
ncbi:hypothetical protein M2139_002432 [Enterococcus sp. PF1-24]|uniref:DUF2969 domain-containing protein n=1 Tax=unclassified Enterococcus TaxID=2608891 RepID=UPI002473747F|nr:MULTISPECIES: DUF2969 domain-containing protein [unclassified Enterococcus]MDH6365429.1 hypothetical protein [Enterococcus sp. PFB1-1]MDH6402530.1 hypothetical protein [Enterococcus sp. PF1-24]